MRAAMSFGTRVEVVPDDDALAHPDIPKDVLTELKPGVVLMAHFGHMMYVRASTWATMKDRFPLEKEGGCS